jgi:hypothetical protein
MRNKAFIIMFIIVFLIFIFSCSEPDKGGENGKKATENIAIGKDVVASSEESVENGGANVVDGDRETYWKSNINEPEYIYIDLEREYTISQIILDWQSHYAEEYQIQVSYDDLDWTTVYNETNGNGRIDDISLSVTGRYVRMYGIVSATSYGFRLYEFEVYEKAGDNSPEGPTGGNIVYNGDFSSGLWQWDRYVDAAADAEIVENDGEVTVTVTDGSTELWHIALIQSPFSFNINKEYSLTFDAWAEAERKIQVEIQEYNNDNNGDGIDWTTYDFCPLYPTSIRRTYTVDFRMVDILDTRARFTINYGTNNTTVTVDNISIVEKGDIAIPSSGTELVKNGDFSDGLNYWLCYNQNGADSTISVESGALHLSINSGGGSESDLHVYQPSPGMVLLENNKYKLVFDAWASAERYLTTVIREEAHDINGDLSSYSPYTMGFYNITETRKTFVLYASIPAPYTTYDASVAYYCGNDTNDLYFDDVSCREIDQFPHESWAGPVNQDGGEDSGSPVSISPDTWYDSSIGTLSDSMWYSVDVSTSGTYEVFLADSGISESYTGVMAVSVYQSDGTTPYEEDKNNGFYDPVVLKPVETTILIKVEAKYEAGTFVFGICQQQGF